MGRSELLDNAWPRLEARLARMRPAARARQTLPPPDPTKPVGADLLPEIGHIVILMMENHSFDSYLGTLGRGDGLPLDDDGLPLAENRTADGRNVRSHRASSTRQARDVPIQTWPETHEQWADGTHAGFVRSAERQAACAGQPTVDPAVAMGYLTGDDLPFYWGLAKTFPLCDRWFSSCLGPTLPNRRFLIAGTANGLTTDHLAHAIDRPANGTLFDLLARRGISWANYHPIPHRGPILKRGLGGPGLHLARRIVGLARRITALATEAPRAKSLLQFTGDAYPIGMLRYLLHVHSIERFLEAAAEGTLPAVSIVDPDFGSCSEENPQDVRHGEAFAARIIDAVMHGAGWPRTLLVWVYDEHGGYYDHVPPPTAVEPDDELPREGSGRRYDRLGIRVPAVIVSPYARPGYVSHIVHDHTSVLKLIETKWNLPPLTRRDAAADDLLDSLDLDGPPAFLTPPHLPDPAL